MSLTFAIAIYFIIWWMTLFAVLPFHGRTQDEAGEVVPGSPGSAPAKPAFLKIFLVNTLIASLIFESDEAFVVTTRLVIALLYTGVLIAGLGFIGQTWLLKRYLPSRVTVISLSQPIFGVLFSWWILGESVGGELYIGAALVVVGSALAQRKVGGQKPELIN